MDYYKLGQRIRKYRKAHGLSQEELAEKVAISTTHMSHIEAGNTKLSLPVLVEITAVLEVRTDDLLYDSHTAVTGTAMDGNGRLPRRAFALLAMTTGLRACRKM